MKTDSARDEMMILLRKRVVYWRVQGRARGVKTDSSCVTIKPSQRGSVCAMLMKRLADKSPCSPVVSSRYGSVSTGGPG